MKIVGIPVGTPLPKSNFDQNDPRKGDYIGGDRSFMNAVTYIEQTLTDEQKAQARENIGALGANEVVEITDIADVPDDFKVYGTAEQDSPSGNLFDGELELGDIYHDTGLPREDDWGVRSKNFIPVTGGSTIIVDNDMDYGGDVFEYDTNQAYIWRDPTKWEEYEEHLDNGAFKRHLTDETRYIKIVSSSMNEENDLSVKYTVMYAGANLFDGELENGGIDRETGAPVYDSTNAITVNFIPVKGGAKISVSFNTDDCEVFEYDEHCSFLTSSIYDTIAGALILSENTRYIKLALYNIVDKVDLSTQITVEYVDIPQESKTYAVNLKEYVESLFPSEVWTFTLADGTTVEKEVVVR